MTDTLNAAAETALISHEAEEALIGALLIAPAEVLSLCANVKPADFGIHRHGFIWQAAQHIAERGGEVDIVSLHSRLADTGKAEEVGGMAYLMGLMNVTPSAYSAETYADIVREKATRRALMRYANNVAKMTINQEWGLDEIQGQAAKQFDDLFADNETDSGLDMLTAMELHWQQMDAAANGKADLISTGLPLIDEGLGGGLSKSDLVYIAGRPGMGKTVLMLNIAKHAAGMGRRVMFVSLEMNIERLVNRMYASYGINGTNLKVGRMTEAEYGIFSSKAAPDLEKMKIRWFHVATESPASLRARLAAARRTFKPDLVIVDYVQLMSAPGRWGGNKHQEISEISRGLKVLATEFDCVLVAGCQLSRGVEQRADKCPTLADLRESGSLEADANVVLALHAPDPERQPDATHIITLKARDGETPTQPAIFEKQFSRMIPAKERKVL